MLQAARAIPGSLAVLLAAAALWFGAQGCGPSPLSQAYDPYAAQVSPRLEAETRFWDQLAERNHDQEDEPGALRYRQFLADKAKPYYAELETALAAIRPGHERLVTAHEQLLGYARSRREFVDLELRRIEMGAKASALLRVQAAQAEDESVQIEYLKALDAVKDVPDHRLSKLNALKTEFLDGKYKRAIDGSGDVADAVDHLRKVCLPQLRELRDGRFDDSPEAQKLRKCIVATEECFQLLADELPALVETVRAATRSAALLEQAKVQRTNYQQQLGNARRDR